MYFIIINSLLYIFLWLLYWQRRKVIDCGFLLIGLWAVISIYGVILYLDYPQRWHITSIVPFLYLFLTFLIFSRMYVFPSSTMNKSMENLVSERNKVLEAMCILYVISAVIIILTTDYSRVAFSMEEIERTALDNYDIHADNAGKKLYTNFLERFSLNYFSTFKIGAMIGAFNLFCQRRNKFATIVALSIIIPSFLDCMLNASRSALFIEIMLYISGYLFYKRYLPREIKKKFYLSAAAVGTLTLLYMIGVTRSRFEDTEMGSEGSIIFYFGQPMLCFSDGVVDSVRNFLYGTRTFKTVFSWVGIEYPAFIDYDLYCGTHFGSNFTTFIGMLVLDFGLIGTMVMGLIIPWVIKKLCMYGKTFTVASLYLYLFFLNRIMFGAFSNKSGADFFYLIALFFYVFFRFVVDRRKKNKIQTRAISNGSNDTYYNFL